MREVSVLGHLLLHLSELLTTNCVRISLEAVSFLGPSGPAMAPPTLRQVVSILLTKICT